MEVEATPAAVAAAEAATGKLDLIVVRATKDELKAHHAQLADIDKASNGQCLWSKLEKA